MRSSADLSLSNYRALAEFRHQIRLFLHFSEGAARDQGVEPQQHQLLLAIKGLPPGTRPTIRGMAGRLQIRHHSTVELVNRLVRQGTLAREANPEDGREVLLRLTVAGERLLRKLSVAHREELGERGPALRNALDAVLQIVHKKA